MRLRHVARALSAAPGRRRVPACIHDPAAADFDPATLLLDGAVSSDDDSNGHNLPCLVPLRVIQCFTDWGL